MRILSSFIILCIFDVIFTFEINSKNCKNAHTFYSSCDFQIKIKSPIHNVLNCSLRFQQLTSNLTAVMLLQKWKLQSESLNKCPFMEIDFYEGKRAGKISTGCGSTIDSLNKTFENVNIVQVSYNNKGLIDNETDIDILLHLWDRKLCEKSDRGWHNIIAIVVAVIIAFIIFIILVLLIKKHYQKQSNDPCDDPAKSAMLSTPGSQVELNIFNEPMNTINQRTTEDAAKFLSEANTPEIQQRNSPGTSPETVPETQQRDPPVDERGNPLKTSPGNGPRNSLGNPVHV